MYQIFCFVIFLLPTFFPFNQSKDTRIMYIAYSRRLANHAAPSMQRMLSTTTVTNAINHDFLFEKIPIDDENINSSIKRSIGIIKFNRPKMLNALSVDMAEGVIDVCERIKSGKENDVKILILTGEGKAFSTGRDLKLSHEFANDPKRERLYMDKAIESVKKIKHLEIPTLAAINGYAFGWGLEVSLACDLRLIANDAICCFPETSIGVSLAFVFYF